MTDDPKNIRPRIAGHLTARPDRTSREIADAIMADYFDVQIELCWMILGQVVEQTGRRNVDGVMRPIYRLREPGLMNG